jgi:protein-S-isoprenylcysteine O-methyltransferase Ste14
MSSAIYLVLWVIFTTSLLVFTLARPHPYRFPRFLAFESILSLIFLNAQTWFLDPFSWRQIFSWAFLVISLTLAATGFFLIKTKGNPVGDFEDTTTLITSGVYRYTRHPLYSSLIAFALGAYLKGPSLIGIGLVLSTILGVYLTARIEENHNLERFGEEYQDYMNKTKRFIPFIF